MKSQLIVLLAALVLPYAVCRGQSGATLVYDEALFNQASSNQTNLMNLLNQQLTQVDSLVQAVNTQLQRMGDYTQVTNLPTTQGLQQSLQTASTSGPLTNSQISQTTQALNGTEVFTTTVDGVFNPIGSTITRKDGTTTPRDPTKYKQQSALQVTINEYYRIRDAAMQEETSLRQTLAEAVTALDQAPDEATVQKQTALIQVIEGELQSCRERITNANNDVSVREKELVNEQKVQATANAENAINAVDLSKITVPPPSGVKLPPLVLPWGPTGLPSAAPASP